MDRANPYLSMDVSKMELQRNEEEKLDAIANGLFKLSYWLVIITCFGFLTLFLFFIFGDYTGIAYKDPDILEWCEKYNPTWTYEQCESMTSR